MFVRRVYLDVIGTLPTADEARAFLDGPRRRTSAARSIDRLLEREEFADYWAMKWCDLLRVKSEFPINLWPNAVQAYHRWIRTAIRDNVPYDQFARELLTSSGSNFRVPPVNFYRAVQSREPQAIAAAVALTFMGARADTWPKERLAGMAAFFSQIGYKPTGEWKEEIVFFDPRQGAAGVGRRHAGGCRVPGRHDRAPASPAQDPREVFAVWLIVAGEPLVRPQHRQPRLVLAAGPRHHPRAGRHPARQPAGEPRAAGVPRAGAGRVPVRPEARLPADPELDAPTSCRRSRQPRRPAAEAQLRALRCCGRWTPRC